MTTPTFDVCVIMRNSARTLPRLFASLAEFQSRGGSVIIADTGSSDDSVEVARSFGAAVTEVGERFIHTIDADLAFRINERFVAEGDLAIVQEGSRLFHFAEARNFCAGLATNDWVCWMDSDEAFTALDIAKIEEIIADPDLEHAEYDFVFAHQDDGVSPAMNFTQSKMYRRSRLKWEGAVHESLYRHAGPPLPIERCNRRFIPPEILHLEHWQQPADHRANYLPGLGLDAYMRLTCDPSKEMDRKAHYLAREMMYTGRYRSAVKLFEEHIAMDRWPAERAQSFIYLGDCWGQLNDPAKQSSCYHAAFHIDSTRRIALLRLAGFYTHNNNWQASLCFSTAALEIPWHGGFYADDRREYEDVPHWFAYRAAGWLGRIEEAKQHFQKVLEFQPYSVEATQDAKYYFGYDPSAAPEGWMSTLELMWLYAAAKEHARVCEVGSWKGRSTHALCSGAAKGGGTVWAVDHWRGSVGEDGPHAEAKADPDAVYRQFIANTCQFDNLIVRRADSLTAAAESKDGFFDFLFVDASHDFDSVLADLRAWGPKVAKGGILAGHDFCDGWPEVRRAVREYLGGEPDQVIGSIWVKSIS